MVRNKNRFFKQLGLQKRFTIVEKQLIKKLKIKKMIGCFSCVNFHFYGLCSVQGSHAGLGHPPSTKKKTTSYLQINHNNYGPVSILARH